MRYKLVYWEIKEKNFNKKDTLKKFAFKNGIRVSSVYEMKKDGMYYVPLDNLRRVNNEDIRAN